MPCRTLMSLFADGDEQRQRRGRYKANRKAGHPQATAPRKESCEDSRFSSPMTEASSNPTRPKQISTPKEFRTKTRGWPGIRKSDDVTAVPNRSQITTPRTDEDGGGNEGCRSRPRLFQPPCQRRGRERFSTTRRKKQARAEAVKREGFVCRARDSCPAPRTKTQTRRQNTSMIVGTYIMFVRPVATSRKENRGSRRRTSLAHKYTPPSPG